MCTGCNASDSCLLKISESHLLLKIWLLTPPLSQVTVNGSEYRGSPHGTLDPHPMRIGDPDSKTTLPPHGLDPDLSCVLCCVTVREIQSSSAMRVVCVPCGAHVRPHWIRIGDPDSVNPFSVPVRRAPLIWGLMSIHLWIWLTLSLFSYVGWKGSSSCNTRLDDTSK